MNRSLEAFYSILPEKYETVNRLITLGMDAWWRRAAARTAAEGGGDRWLDLCAGTGDMTLLLESMAPEKTIIYAADFSLPMLSRAALKEESEPVRFLLSEASLLPFADGSFDLVTVSFAARNLDAADRGLARTFREISRILKPGGRFVNLETSRPDRSLLRILSDIYVRAAVGLASRTASGSGPAYRYLSKSIRSFYTRGELSGILLSAGFSEVSSYPMFGGVVAVHRAVKSG